MKVRIATFNCENLFARFKFRANAKPDTIQKNGFSINDVKFDFHSDKIRKLTAAAIKAVKPDVIALQEVENLDVLERFRNNLLGGFKAFPYMMLIDGNDPRFIDVAILSKYPLVHARSYQHLKSSPNAKSFIFSRDCLEVDVDVAGTLITMYVNHFKSMMGGRAQTKQRRVGQIQATKKIITQTFGSSNPGNYPFIVLGDFNDYIEAGDLAASSLPPLVRWNQVENVVDRLPALDRWTHFFKKDKSYRQLDYILVSKSLRDAVKSVRIERQGMPKRATRYTGPRFNGVGEDNPKSSDHCPVVVELDI